MLAVNDATRDVRFVDNPLVTGDPNIRFYAGSPLVTPSGRGVGTLCVIDSQPRELSSEQLTSLEALSRQATSLIQLPRPNNSTRIVSRGIGTIQRVAAGVCLCRVA